MFSDALQEAIEKEVVGQIAAVRAIVRGVTRIAAGLTPRERSWCAFLFMGPSGTGKTQIVHTLAKIVHGANRGLHVADCTTLAHVDPWAIFAGQLAPMFSVPRMDADTAVLDAPPLSIVLVEYLERGRREFPKALAAALDTGRIPLPSGRVGSLRNTLLFLTSSLGSREILEEAPRIGFQASPEADAAEDRTYRSCLAKAQEHFGQDLVARLDTLVVFHKLEEGQLAEILDRRAARMNRWLAERGVRCALRPTARDFLLARGRGDPRLGARELVRAYREYVEFPVADLLISGRVPPASRIDVEHDAGTEHLHFEVAPVSPPHTACIEVAVT